MVDSVSWVQLVKPMDVQFDHGSLHTVRSVCGLFVEILIYRLGTPEDYDGLAEHTEVQNVPFEQRGSEYLYKE